MRTEFTLKRFAIATACSLLFFVSHTSAQSIYSNGRFEVGGGLGPMFFLGDLGGSAGIGKGFVKDVDLPLTKLGKAIYVSYHPSELLGFRLGISHGVLEGDDKKAPDKGGAEIYRLQRNLSFKTSAFEAMLTAEVYPTTLFEKYDGLQGKLRPYGVIGFGMMKYNPKAQDIDGQWVELKPLMLEGQGMAEYPDRKPYKLWQHEIPMGIGVKYFIKENFYVGLEVLHRQLFTDYIDDVSTNYIDPVLFDNYLSATDAARARRLHYRGTFPVYQNPGSTINEQRGDPKDNDAFFSTLIRVGWRLGNSDGNSRARRQMRCPVFY